MISVAMASYNGQDYIVKQLDSIRCQTKPVDQCIIVDDCSTDETVTIIENCQKEHPDLPICLYRNEQNLGYRRNFKKAVSLTNGDYIFLCDQDDIWNLDKVEKMIDIMKTNTSILALNSSFTFIDEFDKPKEVELIPAFSNNNLYRRPVAKDALVEIPFDEMLIQNGFQGCACCMRKEIKELFLQCFTEQRFHDWLINLLASANHGLYFYNHPLFQYRVHSKNTIGINEVETLSEKDRLKKTNTLHWRTLFAQSSVESIEILESVYPDLYRVQPDIAKKKDFYKKHIEYLDTGKVVSLLLQNFSPYYGRIKTKKARIMDLYFALHRKSRRG